MHASSVDSSLMSDFSETSSLTESSVSDISEDDNVSLSELSTVDSLSTFPASERALTDNVKQPECFQRFSANRGAGEKPQKHWFSQFRTEQEWHDYQTSVVDEIMKAMDDCPFEERDALLAELIANEEHVFWGGHLGQEETITAVPKNSWIWEVFAVAGTMAVAGVALVRLWKTRS